MALPAGYASIRFGYVQVGDYIFVPAIGSYIEVEVGSIYLGSSVDSHAIVQRHGRDVFFPPTFTSHSERCDHVREHDSVDLYSRSGMGYPGKHYRVVTGKDQQFVYLRKTMVGPGEGTTNKVCRRTGKVWNWTPTGWELTDLELRLPQETGADLVDIPMSAAKALRGGGFYGD